MGQVLHADLALFIISVLDVSFQENWLMKRNRFEPRTDNWDVT